MLPDNLSSPHEGATLGWGHMVGALALSGARRPVGDLAARAELEDLLANYCWAIDERRPDLLEDILTEGFVWRGSVEGSRDLGPLHGRERFLEWQRLIWDKESAGQPRHLLHNTVHTRERSGNPTTHSYLTLVANEGGVHRSLTSGFAVVGFALETGNWCIARVFQGWDSPPWRRKPAEMSSGERRLRLIRESALDQGDRP